MRFIFNRPAFNRLAFYPCDKRGSASGPVEAVQMPEAPDLRHSGELKPVGLKPVVLKPGGLRSASVFGLAVVTGLFACGTVAFGQQTGSVADSVKGSVKGSGAGASASQTGTNGTDRAYEARGLVRSSARVEYRTDLIAPVLKTPFLEGMAFARGDILVDFDCKRQRAELKVAQARANAAWLDHKSKKRLLVHKAIGRDEVAMAAATAAEASAEVNVHKTKGEGCRFKAPFAGRMVELNARPGELPVNDKPLFVIIKDSVLELEMVVPSFWLTWMEKGRGFSFKIDETGETLTAAIERIGAEVDPVSQTIKVVGVLKTRGTRTLAGMSGNAWFETTGSVGDAAGENSQ